jgi:hypothetical protein
LISRLVACIATACVTFIRQQGFDHVDARPVIIVVSLHHIISARYRLHRVDIGFIKILLRESARHFLVKKLFAPAGKCEYRETNNG